MILNVWEMIDIALMSAIVGYIFSDSFGRFAEHDDLLHRYRRGLDLNAIKFSVMATAPAIILHELAHKFVAVSFGFSATFQAAYTWLIIGLVMKAVNFGFIFFVPAYVSILGTGTPLQYSLIAFAGPATNGILWGISELIVRKKLVSKKYIPLAFLTAKINMFLFIFNMLPLPMFDGAKVFSGIYQAFAG